MPKSKSKSDLFSILREAEVEKEITKSDKKSRGPTLNLNVQEVSTSISSLTNPTSGYCSSDQRSSTRESSVVSDASTLDISLVIPNPKTLYYQSPLPAGIVCAKKSLPPKCEDSEDQDSQEEEVKSSPKSITVAPRLTRKNNAKSSSIATPPQSSDITELSPICVICSKPFRAKGCHYSKVDVSIAGLKRRFCEYFDIDIKEVDPKVEGFLRREKFPFCQTCFVLVHDLYRRGEQVRSALAPLQKVREAIRQKVTTGLKDVGETSQNETAVPYYDIKQMVIQQHFLSEEEQDGNLCDIAKRSLGRTMDEIPMEALENTSSPEDSELYKNEDANDAIDSPIPPVSPAKVSSGPMSKIVLPVQSTAAVKTKKRCKTIPVQPKSPLSGQIMEEKQEDTHLAKQPLGRTLDQIPIEALENMSGAESADVDLHANVMDYPVAPVIPAKLSSEPISPPEASVKTKKKRKNKKISVQPSRELMEEEQDGDRCDIKQSLGTLDELPIEALENVPGVQSADVDLHVNENVIGYPVPAKISSEPMSEILIPVQHTVTTAVKTKKKKRKKIPRVMEEEQEDESLCVTAEQPLGRALGETSDIEASKNMSGVDNINYSIPPVPPVKLPIPNPVPNKMLPVHSTAVKTAKNPEKISVKRSNPPFSGQLTSSRPLFNMPSVKSAAVESSSEDSDDEALRRLRLKSTVVTNLKESKCVAQSNTAQGQNKKKATPSSASTIRQSLNLPKDTTVGKRKRRDNVDSDSDYELPETARNRKSKSSRKHPSSKFGYEDVVASNSKSTTFEFSPTHKLGGVTNYKELATQIKRSSGFKDKSRISRQLLTEDDSN